MRSREIEEEPRIKWVPTAEMERRSREAVARALELTQRNAVGEKLKEIEKIAHERVARALAGKFIFRESR